MNSRNKNSLITFLIALAIGLGLGILFAPDKGSNTRTKMKDGFRGFKK